MPSTSALASPASLKGVLSAVGAAAALVAGFEAAGVAATALPVADGGDGTAEVLEAALGGEWREARVSDALGRPIDARWLLLPDGTAVVESAEAIGLRRLSPEELDPMRASSRGLGELILAGGAGPTRSLLVGLGGSATVDGGAGLREVFELVAISDNSIARRPDGARRRREHLRTAEGRDAGAGRRARGSAGCDARAGAVRRPSRLRSCRRPRRRLRGPWCRARPGEPYVLERVGFRGRLDRRPGRHRRGPRGPDDAWKGRRRVRWPASAGTKVSAARCSAALARRRSPASSCTCSPAALRAAPTTYGRSASGSVERFCASPLGASERAQLCLAEPLGHDLQELPRDRRVVLDEGAEGP